ncbi:protein of unknown function DUF891 [hydrothermal vent metagenome]|uniref:Uncharacterized protein n=1 Tax=hydrothermal vent metagenome TaxID=652676 RepID=A0A3B1AYA7_9ZZZZ
MHMDVVFYRMDSGSEPVRDWLKGLTKAEKQIIGGDIKTVQYGWPLGMPVVRKGEIIWASTSVARWMVSLMKKVCSRKLRRYSGQACGCIPAGRDDEVTRTFQD